MNAPIGALKMINTYEQEGIWYAYWTDAFDGKQLGITCHAVNRDDAIYLLGLNMGANPAKFSRPIA